MSHLNAALEYAQANRARFTELLKEFTAIPSISTSPEHVDEMHKAADWVANRLRGLGMDNVQIFPTARHPLVYADWLHAGPDKPTVLIYGHYDVQPVDPIDLWTSDPFGCEVRGENMYARGVSDMKGQDSACFNAVESVIKTGTFPVNIKWLVEGEEEIGSPSLDAFIESHKDLLKCDFALNPDSGLLGAEYPSITYGLRGLAYFELRVYGPASDLHSGVFGGAVHNPANVLAKLIAGMHDENGHITLPGFYNRVRPLSEQERGELARLPVNAEMLKQMTGAPELFGEAGFSPVEQIGARPTLDVNGMLSGFTGAGSKTVLPAYAMAKISTRLVPDQDPAEVHQQLRAYLEANAPKSVRWELEQFAGGRASISDLNNIGVQAMSKALEAVWGKKTLFKREGGSVPVVAQMQNLLGVESVLCGFALPDDNFHAPNEKLHLPTWYRGTDALIHFFFAL
jgi:acetylornithine deacetylase/succinyl-diaminopimelate desuccinylase-like protein